MAAAIAQGQALSPAVIATSGDIPFAGAASGYVLDSLSLAVAAVLDERPLAEVLVDVTRIGNDSDTNAAIAGGLLGARDGSTAIPRRWTAVLQFAGEFTTAGAVLARRQGGGRAAWPSGSSEATAGH